MPEIEEGYRANFATLIEAAQNGDLCLTDCRDKATGNPARVVCATYLEGGEVVLVPLARLFDGNPYEVLDPPGYDLPDSPDTLEDRVNAKLQATAEALRGMQRNTGGPGAALSEPQNEQLARLLTAVEAEFRYRAGAGGLSEEKWKSLICTRALHNAVNDLASSEPGS